jgi:cytochrome P450
MSTYVPLFLFHSAPSQDYAYTRIENGLEKNYTLPKGTHVQVALFQIQHDSAFWKNPEEFNPDRFYNNPESKTIKQIMYQAFGKGKRECIGKRFAMLVLKLTIANLLKKYKLLPSSLTEGKITIQYKVATITPRYGSWFTPATA